MVEFALVAPLLFVLLFGMLDLGKAFNYWNVEQQMASEGARMAAVNATGTCPGASTATTLPNYIKCQAVTNELRNGGSVWLANPVTVCIDSPLATPRFNTGDPVRVTVTINFRWLPALNPLLKQLSGSSSNSTLSGTTSITGAATMRLEAPLDVANRGCST